MPKHVSPEAYKSSHRLSTIMNADRIIVVENGKILEQGGHDELIVAGGRYADLWSKQVFIRPSDDEDKKAKTSAEQAGFFNDLSSEQTKTELSKVKPADSKDQRSGSGQNVTGSTPKRTQEVDDAKEN